MLNNDKVSAEYGGDFPNYGTHAYYTITNYPSLSGINQIITSLDSF